MQPLAKRVSQKRNNAIYAYEDNGHEVQVGTYRTCVNNRWENYGVYQCNLGGDECWAAIETYDKYLGPGGCCGTD